MAPRQLMALWEKHWGVLSPELRERFLDRVEVFKICRFPDVSIQREIRNSRKLFVILRLLELGPSPLRTVPYNEYYGTEDFVGPIADSLDASDPPGHQCPQTEMGAFLDDVD